jgi:hypothetical protein
MVTNQHSVSHGTHYTIGVGGRYTRTYMGFSDSASNQIGNVVFFTKGIPRMTFIGVSDPHGLANLANYEIKQQHNVTDGMTSLFQN